MAKFEIDDMDGMSEIKEMEFIYPDLTVLHLKNGMCVGISVETVCVYKSYKDIELGRPADCTDVFSEIKSR